MASAHLNFGELEQFEENLKETKTDRTVSGRLLPRDLERAFSAIHWRWSFPAISRHLRQGRSGSELLAVVSLINLCSAINCSIHKAALRCKVHTVNWPDRGVDWVRWFLRRAKLKKQVNADRSLDSLDEVPPRSMRFIQNPNSTHTNSGQQLWLFGLRRAGGDLA